MAASTPIRPPIRHGTSAGYKRCVRNGGPCEDCHAFWRDDQARRRAQAHDEVARNRARVAAGLAPILPPRGTATRQRRPVAGSETETVRWP